MTSHRCDCLSPGMALRCTMSITLYWKPIRGTRTETLQPLRNPEAMEKKLSINRSFTPETNQTNIYIYIFPEADQYLPFFLKEMKSFDLP